MIYILELVGVACFAVSGVAASRSKRPDLVGAIILAFATALGGGVIRDAILGVPAESFHDRYYFVAILVGALVAMQLPAVIQRFGSTLRIADAIGRTGFPPVHLAPINFEALYQQQLAQMQQPTPAVTN